jgi:TPR repeat protein
MRAIKTTAKAISLYNQSLDYWLGRGVAKDDQRAFALNAEAAQQGYADAVLAMGWFYLNGVGVERNIERARKWYHDSAGRGEPKAMFSLGQIAYDERDYFDALVWFKRASDAGHNRSLYFIGKLYWRGHGVEQDKKEAMRYFHRAASSKVDEAQRVLRFLTSRSG